MKGLLLRWMILTIAILAAAYVIEGIAVTGFWSALLGAALLGVLNVFFRPILLLLTLPINILSFGLFTFVINALLLMMASGVIAGLQVSGFGAALLGSLIISIVNWVLTSFINDQGRVEYIELRRGPDDRWQ